MTTEDLIKLADSYAKVGDSADISLIKHHRSALKSALEALGREVAELKLRAGNGYSRKIEELIAERDTLRAELESKSAELESVWNLSKKADEENDTLRAALAAIRAQEPVAWGVLDKRTGKHWYTHESKFTAQHYANEYSHREPDGSLSMVIAPLYASPVAKDAGLVAALKDAATSLETISRLAGRTHYVGDDGERVETYMGHHDQVRGYAISRASVARDALSKIGGV